MHGSFTIMDETSLFSAVPCGPLPSVKNAVSFASGGSYGSIVTFVCNSGLDLIGQQNLICQADGTWSSPAPSCEGKKADYRYFV